MNCIDIRRILAATPASREPDVLRHLQQCQSCARYAESEKALSTHIDKLLNIAVPDRLTFRIMLQQRLAEEKRFRHRRGYWQALAASVVLTVGLVAGMLVVNHPYSLGEVALAHVRDEPMALQVEDNIQLSQLNNLLVPYNLKLQQAIGRVAFAMPCRIRQYTGAHLVMKGEYGKVTVLIMPGEYVMARKMLQERELQGLLIPTDGGSIAIIGQAHEPLTAIEARISQALIHTV